MSVLRYASGTIRRPKVSSFHKIYGIHAPQVTETDGKTQLPIGFDPAANLVETRLRPTIPHTAIPWIVWLPNRE
jgi:hypothetical protein